MWEKVILKYERVHILVNNAAIARGKTIKSLTIEEFRITMAINFLSIVHLSKLFVGQKMIDQHNHLVNINSVAGF